MAQLEIKNQQKISYIDKLVQYLHDPYYRGYDPPTLRIKKEDDNLMVMINWTNDYAWEGPETYYLSYKVEGLKDLIGSFHLDAKLSDYVKTDGSNMTDDISNKLMSHHTAQVFDFLSALDIQYNVFGTEG